MAPVTNARLGAVRRRVGRRPSSYSRGMPCVSRLPPERSGLEFYSRAAGIPRDPRGRRIFKKLAGEEREHLATLEARYKQLLAADQELESRPPFLFFKDAANGLFAAGADQLTKGVNDKQALMNRHPLRARLTSLLQAVRGALRRFRGEASLPRVCGRRAPSPRASDSRVPRARQASRQARQGRTSTGEKGAPGQRLDFPSFLSLFPIPPRHRRRSSRGSRRRGSQCGFRATNRAAATVSSRSS